MIKLYVGPNEYTLNSARDIDEGELAQHIAKAKAGGVCPCVRVTIEEQGIAINLQTAGCPPSGVGTRMANSKEKEVLDMWGERHLKDDGFAPGNLISFLKSVLKYLGR